MVERPGLFHFTDEKVSIPNSIRPIQAVIFHWASCNSLTHWVFTSVPSSLLHSVSHSNQGNHSDWTFHYSKTFNGSLAYQIKSKFFSLTVNIFFSFHILAWVSSVDKLYALKITFVFLLSCFSSSYFPSWIDLSTCWRHIIYV